MGSKEQQEKALKKQKEREAQIEAQAEERYNILLKFCK